MSTENNSRVPRLRFPGFNGDWVEKKLGDVLDYEQPTAYLVEDANYKKSGIPVLTAGKTFVLGYTHETEGVYDKLPVIIFDDFVTDSKYVDFPFKAMSSAMKMLRLANGENNLRVVFEAMQLLHYPVKEHKRYWISEYSKQSILLPPTLAEQKKIAECLEEMDNLITAQNENVDALKEKKKGLMQQLFPQNGETTPRLRFPGFEGEWIEKRLGDVCSVNRGVRVTRKDLTEDGLYPVFQNTNRPLGFYNLSNVEPNNPFVIIGGSAGLVGFCKTKFWAADDCAYFGDADGLNKYFLYCTLLLHIAEIKDNVRGGNIPRLERASLERIIMHLPSLAEQQKIADCLSTLDDQIAAETAKLEALKDHKKGLMQQLFPQPAK